MYEGSSKIVFTSSHGLEDLTYQRNVCISSSNIEHKTYAKLSPQAKYISMDERLRRNVL